MKFDDKAPFSALAFKVANDPFVGSLTFIRVYSGTIKSGTGIFNSSKEKELFVSVKIERLNFCLIAILYTIDQSQPDNRSFF